MWWQVIAINGKFPGPIVNVSTNWNVVANVLNDLDESLLLTWYCRPLASHPCIPFQISYGDEHWIFKCVL